MTEDERGPDDAEPRDLATWSGAYVLNALSDEERREFEGRLHESASIRDEVTELADTAVLLGLAVAPVDPTPALKHGIMARLPVIEQRGRVETRRRTRLKVPWYRRPLLVIAAAVVAVALIVGGGLVANIVSSTGFAQAQADRMAAITSADDVQRSTADVTGGGTATLVWSDALAQACLFVEGLDRLPDHRAYELWYLRASGEAVPAGLLRPDADGTSWRVLDGALEGGDSVGLTVEPRGGSEQPSSEPVVAIAAD